jgi:hypothetical protein
MPMEMNLPAYLFHSKQYEVYALFQQSTQNEEIKLKLVYNTSPFRLDLGLTVNRL